MCKVPLNFMKGIKHVHTAIRTPHYFRPVNTHLSPREQDVLRLKASGMSAPQIANALFISEQTVKNHLTSIYKKFNLHTCDSPGARACYLYGVARATIQFPEIMAGYERQKEIAQAQNLRADDI